MKLGGGTAIARAQKQPLRELTDDERSYLRRLSRSTSAPAAHVTRARAILAVAAGRSYSEAARECGQSTGDTVARWVARFNEEGLSAIVPRHGGGRRPAYSMADRETIIELARQPRGTGRGQRWSLASLREHLIGQGLPAPSIYTLWHILREADLEWMEPRSGPRRGGMARDKAKVGEKKS